jgi:thiamine biosynthesis lipoprotein
MGGARRSSELREKSGFLQGTFVAMGSPCELLFDTSDAAIAQQLTTAVATEAWRIEDRFSRYLSGNVVHRINNAAGKPITVDDETAGLLDFATTLFELSEGRFDISSGVLREVWHFDGGDRLPDAEAVAGILERVGWHKVTWRRPTLTMPAGMQIDFGGLGKEYAVDRAAGIVAAQSEVPALLNFGGDLFATAVPRSQDDWRVGIESCNAAEQKANRLIRLQRGGLATSGDARRFLEKGGVRYGHILDPLTGWPVRDAPRSITVAADTCTEAGMTATMAMLRGRQAEEFLQQQGVQHWVFR